MVNFRHFPIYLGVAALAATAVSCDDFLDATPDQRVTIETPEQVRLLLVDAYANANYGTVCEFSTDNVIDNTAPDDNGMRYNLTYYDLQDLEAFGWDNIVSNMDTDSPSSIWAGYYHAIAVCNNALEAIEKLEKEGRAEEVAALKGEALVSRAYHHFILANIFAMPYAGETASASIPGIPYMTEPETKVLVHYERQPLSEVYAHIAADLEEGLPLINDGIYSVPKYHFNRKAACAFAARFYLFARDYEKAEAYATEALGGPTANPAGFMRNFWAKSFTSYDALVAAYVSADEQSNLMLLPTYSVFNRRRGSRFALNRDAKAATIYGNGPTWNTSYTHYYCHPCYAGKIYIRSSQEYGCFFPKAGEIFEYTDKIAGIGYCHVIRCEFTAEEALLTRAEARIWQGRIDEAIADLAIWDESRQKLPDLNIQFPKLTRKAIEDFYTTDPEGYGVVKPLNIDRVYPSPRYTTTPDIEPYLQCVLHFRRIETIDDGMRWFDIRRYGIEINHKIGLNRVETLAWNDPRRAIQIPPEVIAAGFTPNERIPKGSNDAPVMMPASLMKVAD
ncbi:MAG: RagB/SusD family nutrient uptake outer membrane protein [Paramuribaculum sp.]|nr:RagB/SusD family nutrient uptake outer membrane protein [Paramuribaculum sp.]